MTLPGLLAAAVGGGGAAGGGGVAGAAGVSGAAMTALASAEGMDNLSTQDPSTASAGPALAPDELSTLTMVLLGRSMSCHTTHMCLAACSAAPRTATDTQFRENGACQTFCSSCRPWRA